MEIFVNYEDVVFLRDLKREYENDGIHLSIATNSEHAALGIPSNGTGGFVTSTITYITLAIRC